MDQKNSACIFSLCMSAALHMLYYTSIVNWNWLAAVVFFRMGPRALEDLVKWVMLSCCVMRVCDSLFCDPGQARVFKPLHTTTYTTYVCLLGIPFFGPSLKTGSLAWLNSRDSGREWSLYSGLIGATPVKHPAQVVQQRFIKPGRPRQSLLFALCIASFFASGALEWRRLQSPLFSASLNRLINRSNISRNTQSIITYVLCNAHHQEFHGFGHTVKLTSLELCCVYTVFHLLAKLCCPLQPLSWLTHWRGSVFTLRVVRGCFMPERYICTYWIHLIYIYI